MSAAPAGCRQLLSMVSRQVGTMLCALGCSHVVAHLGDRPQLLIMTVLSLQDCGRLSCAGAGCGDHRRLPRPAPHDLLRGHPVAAWLLRPVGCASFGRTLLLGQDQVCLLVHYSRTSVSIREAETARQRGADTTLLIQADSHIMVGSTTRLHRLHVADCEQPGASPSDYHQI